MTSPQKRKGSGFERDVAKYLSQWFPYMERRQAGTFADRGDLDGLPGFVVECKNHATLRPAEWLDRLAEQMENGRARFGVVIVKRRGKQPQDAYAIMPLHLWAQLVDDYMEVTNHE